MKIAVVAAVSKRGEVGGAERFYAGLSRALKSAGMQTDLVECLSDESSFDAIKRTYLKFYDLDLAQYDGVISTKAPSYVIRHRNHVCYLVHTMRVFYDMFEAEFPNPSKELLEQREFIRALDTAALSAKRVNRIFTIGHEISDRLRKFNALESEVLHPALLFDNFTAGTFGDYVFLPGRLHRWKRVDLVIRALKYSERPVKLKIAGIGEDESGLRLLAGSDARIEFLGRVSDDALIALYANALAVPFVPLREDYGYVTLEAFKSGKPVITCRDSGEPAHLVKDCVSGFICEPDPKVIARKIDHLYDHRDMAREMGKSGKKSIEHISWKRIVDEITTSLKLSIVR
jgi:glycosyltransferase involved in cell wall biosynthesis